MGFLHAMLAKLCWPRTVPPPLANCAEPAQLGNCGAVWERSEWRAADAPLESLVECGRKAGSSTVHTRRGVCPQNLLRDDRRKF